MNLHTIPSLVAQSGSGVPWVPGAGGTRPAWPPYIAPAGTRMAAPCAACSGGLTFVDGAAGAGCRSPGGRSPLCSWFLYVAGSRPHIHTAARSAARGSSVVLLCKPRAITPAPGCRGKLLVGAFVRYLQYLLMIVWST